MTTRETQDLKIAVVGDVHDCWDEQDEQALRHLGVDLVLLVGDFGNESRSVVRAIASLQIPSAVILGNHDAWYSATDWGIKKCPYDRQREDWVQDQLDALGKTHVGYGKQDFSSLGVSVVGGRPFSWGGSKWQLPRFYRDRYNITSFEESTARIVTEAQATTCNTLIFISHCGPKGLGDRPEDPCGRDWNPPGGDYGDPDLTAAIAQTRQQGKQIPLVAFGHMHHNLRHSSQRRKILAVDEAGTVYVNAACVPRIVPTDGGSRRNFTIVTLAAGQVTQVSLMWLQPDFAIESEEVLYSCTETVNPVVQSTSSVNRVATRSH